MAMVAVDPKAGVAGNPQLSGVLFYLLSYTLMTVGAFAVVSLLAKDGDEDARSNEHNWLLKGEEKTASVR